MSHKLRLRGHNKFRTAFDIERELLQVILKKVQANEKCFTGKNLLFAYLSTIWNLHVQA